MSITYHERPGVYVEYDTTSRAAAVRSRVAGIAALASGSGLYRFASVNAARAVFPASTALGRMLALAFGNGAATVLCCPVSEGYADAFALLAAEADVIATDCRDAEALARQAPVSLRLPDGRAGPHGDAPLERLPGHDAHSRGHC